VSSVDQSLHEFADVFCRYYDALDEALVRERWLEWERDRNWDSTKVAVYHDVVHGRGTVGMIMRVDNSSNPQLATLAALRGMDEAFRFVNPTLQGIERTPTAMLRLQKFVEVRGHLSSETVDGALIPRVARRADPTAEVEHLRDLFTYVQRVPSESWNRADRVSVPPGERFRGTDLRAGVDIACVPVIGDPAEIHLEPHSRNGARFYRLMPRDLAVTLDRVGDVVGAIDASGAQIAVAPEATLSAALLARWQHVLAGRRSTRLRYVVVGSGDVRAGGRSTSNAAVLLDGGTGRVVGTQDKMYRFDLSPGTLRRWQLTHWLGDQPIAEDLAVTDRRLTVFDLGAIRLAILICEDLNKLLDIGPLVRDLGISHLLVPVFSRPVQPYRWEQSAGTVHVRETGTAVVVANSLIMASILHATNPGTALLIKPDGDGVLLGRSPDPNSVVCFHIHPDGSADLR
jgi:predicted amidohydrolase